MNKIYTIMTFMMDKKTGKIVRERVVGWQSNKVDAERVILKNLYDIHEAGYYPMAVIEEVSEGCYPHSKSWWYKWREESVEGYKSCKKPAKLKHFINFTMG